MKDIIFLKYEPLLEKLRDIRAYEKKVKKSLSKKNRDLAERLLTRKPSYKLDKPIRERYPEFIDALRELDESLNRVHLFAALPAVDGEKIPVNLVHNCRRLSHEWQAYISRTNSLRKVFVSVKGIYYQAEVKGQKIIWLAPHATQQVLPEIDYRIMLTFLELDESLLQFVNLELYHSINVKYPPILDPKLEVVAADLYALSRFFDAYNHGSSMKPASDSSSTSEGTKPDETELLNAQLSSNEPGTLMRLVGDDAQMNEEDDETRECRNLFRNMTFFLSREVPRESFLFLIPAFGGTVSWEGEGAPLKESDQRITHQVVDRPTQDHKFLTRDYIQPQWVYDSVNARMILPTDKYTVGCITPPHLSPFVDNQVEGHVPEYAQVIELLKASRKKQVLPLPGNEKQVLDSSESLLDCIDQSAAVKTNRKMKMLEKQYHNELKLEQEVQGASFSLHGAVEEDDVEEDLNQMDKDLANMSKVFMSSKKRGLLNAIEMGQNKKHQGIQLLKKRKKQLEEAKNIS